MDLITPELLQPLGISAIFVVFLVVMWKKLNEKDDYIKQITDKLSEKYEEDISIKVQLNNTLDANNKLIEKALDRFSDAMRGHNE